MMPQDTYQVLESVSTIYNSLTNVNRALDICGGDRPESTAEHSTHLSYLVMAVIPMWPHLGLDLGKCIQLALTHDLVEAFVGDLNAITTSREKLELQELLEKTALNFFASRYKESLPVVVSSAVEYIRQQTPEAKFVFALDKLAPFFVELPNEMLSSELKGATVSEIKTRILARLKDPPKEILDLLETLCVKANQYLPYQHLPPYVE